MRPKTPREATFVSSSVRAHNNKLSQFISTRVSGSKRTESPVKDYGRHVAT